jgi:hypothetical protein
VSKVQSVTALKQHVSREFEALNKKGIPRAEAPTFTSSGGPVRGAIDAPSVLDLLAFALGETKAPTGAWYPGLVPAEVLLASGRCLLLNISWNLFPLLLCDSQSIPLCAMLPAGH